MIKQHLLLAVAFPRLGDPERSAAELSAAQDVSLKPSPSMQAEIWRTAGLLQSRAGQTDAAIASLQKSLSLARQQHDTFLEAADLLNLGFVALRRDHYDEALTWFNAATLSAQSIHAADIAQVVLGNAGWAYYALGDFDRALSSFEQAELQARELGASDSEILWLQSAGLAHFRTGNIEQARSNYEAALKMSELAGNAPRTGETQTSLGLLFLQAGQLDIARTYANDALRGARSIAAVSSELDAMLLQGLIAARDPSTQEAESTLLSVYRSTEKLPSLRWQVEAALADVYARQHDDRRAEPWFRRSIQTFEAQRASIHDEETRLPFFANGETLYRNYADFLIARNRSDEALYLLDKARARALDDSLTTTASPSKSQTSGTAMDATHTAAKLDGVILFYSLGPQSSYLWAISPQRIERFPLPSEVEIAAHATSYQATILRASDPLREANPDAQWLYRTLVAPAEALLQDHRDVFIIRNGRLNNLNFETLLKPGPKSLHYWVDDVRIANASSIRLLARAAQHQQPRSDAHPRLLLIGNPVSASADYPALASASIEVEGVAHSFPDAQRTIFTQAQATPAVYKQSHPESFTYIHFVAHGTASTQRPLDSAVVLSAPASQPDAFRLYARDIVPLRLTANLVTISACYGSGTRNYAGEGLVGLSWAFLRAGSHNVIGALWAVDDASTAQLMGRLYGNLSTGKQPAEALQQTKLAMLHSDGVYRKPFYWAAFQLYSGS